MRAGTVWRTMIVLAVVLGAVALALSPFLFRLATKASDEARAAAAANTATICSIGSFLTQSPITRLPGVSDRDFRRQLFVARAFLVDLRELECRRGDFGRAARPQAIERQISAIQRELDQLPHRPRGGDRRSPTGRPAAPPPQVGPVITSPTVPSLPLPGDDGSSSASPPSAGQGGSDGDGDGGPGSPGSAPPDPGPAPVDEISQDLGQTVEDVGTLGQQVACQLPQVAEHNPLCP